MGIQLQIAEGIKVTITGEIGNRQGAAIAGIRLFGDILRKEG